MLVRLEKDWDYTDLRCQTPGLDGRWDDLFVTTDPIPECDLLVVLNSPRRDIRVRVPAGNKWLFSQESPIEKYRWHHDSFAYFDRIFTFWDGPFPERIVHDHAALPWHVGRNYVELAALTRQDALAAKRDAVSWVTSNARWKEGHQTRMRFKDYLLEEGFAFDLFGRGFNPVAHKFDGLFPYKYSIAVENHACDHYWTEKIADCFLSWTMPIYSGATNILSYFPKESMILIDPSDQAGALQTIREAMASDRFGRNLDAVEEARRLVLEKYQFFPNLQHLRARYASSLGTTRERAFIPANRMHYATESAVGHLKIAVKSALAQWAWRLR